jgi:hypothetical protein
MTVRNRHLLAVAAIFLGFIVLAYVATLSASYGECATKHQQSYFKQNAPDFLEKAGTVLVCEGVTADANGELLTAIATVLLTIVTGGLVWLGWLQFNSTRAQLRAYVFATDLKQYWDKIGTTGQYGWRFRPIWTNSGDTPTRELEINTECEIRNSLLPPDFSFPFSTRPGHGLIAPKTSSEGSLAPPPPQALVTPQDIFDAQNGNKHIYVYGYARYRDIFPGTSPHITRFCWELIMTGDPFTFIPDDPNHRLVFQWAHQSRGNCSDGECADARIS